MPAIHLRTPNGRPWSIKEIAQGKPLGHPSHAMVVHFPIALYVVVLAFDILSRAGRFNEAPIAATWLTLGGLGGAVLAAATGLIDWWGMVPGSTKRTWATRHMLLQLGATTLFGVALLLRWPGRHAARASAAWIAVEAVGVAILLFGNWIGGALVYEMGMRVGRARPTGAPDRPTPAAASLSAEPPR